MMYIWLALLSCDEEEVMIKLVRASKTFACGSKSDCSLHSNCNVISTKDHEGPEKLDPLPALLLSLKIPRSTCSSCAITAQALFQNCLCCPKTDQDQKMLFQNWLGPRDVLPKLIRTKRCYSKTVCAAPKITRTRRCYSKTVPQLTSARRGYPKTCQGQEMSFQN